MYKQCFELLTAQGKKFSVLDRKTDNNRRPITLLSRSNLGPKPHKSFSVGQGPAEVLKEFDPEIKGNVFSLAGQRIQLPPNPSQMATDFHNTGGVATKKVGVTSSLNIVHQYLVFQLYVPSGESFSLELHVRDKHNVSKFFEK